MGVYDPFQTEGKNEKIHHGFKLYGLKTVKTMAQLFKINDVVSCRFVKISTTKNNSVFAYVVGIYLTSWSLSDDIMLTMSWTSGSWNSGIITLQMYTEMIFVKGEQMTF